MIVKSAQPQLRHHHERKEENHGWHGNRPTRLIHGDRLTYEQSDGAQESDAGPVQLKERQASQQHAEINQNEDDSDSAQALVPNANRAAGFRKDSKR